MHHVLDWLDRRAPLTQQSEEIVNVHQVFAVVKGRESLPSDRVVACAVLGNDTRFQAELEPFEGVHDGGDIQRSKSGMAVDDKRRYILKDWQTRSATSSVGLGISVQLVCQAIPIIEPPPSPHRCHLQRGDQHRQPVVLKIL